MASEAQIIDGRHQAHLLREDLKEKAKNLLDLYGVTPGLAIIRVGDDPASELYVSSKGRQAHEVGFSFREYDFPSDVTQEEVLKCIETLNKDPHVHGIIVQLPLPEHLDKFTFIKAIDPQKDVDGLHPLNAGKLIQGDHTGLVPCTPQGCKLLLDTIHPKLDGKDVLVIGCSILVGKPMASILINCDATVMIAHSLTKNLPELCKKAEVMIVAIGDPLFIQADWIRPGATVIDVGINRLEDDRIVGDVDFENACQVAGAITPVPGGVGPMTVACLLRNTYIAAEQSIIIE